MLKEPLYPKAASNLKKNLTDYSEKSCVAPQTTLKCKRLR